jgi:hypothetical protein
MTYDEFCEYFYKTYSNNPLPAQVDKQAKTIFHLKMELAKLKKKVYELSSKKED